MADHIYKKIEVTGTSTESMAASIQNAIARAGKTVHNMRWFEVTELRGDIKDDRSVEHWQITLKIGFTLDE